MLKPVHSLLAAFGASALLVAAAQAAPVTLTFEPFVNTASLPELGPEPNPFAESGFTFTYDSAFRTGFEGGGFFFIGPEAPCIPDCTQSGSTAFYQFNTGALSVARTDGGIFSLLSLDAAQAFARTGAELELHVLGMVLGGGIVEATFSATPSVANSFTTFALPDTFNTLLSVQFFGTLITEDSTSNFALDNLVVMREAIATPPTSVPEPMSAALFAVGAVGLRLTRRRKISPKE